MIVDSSSLVEVSSIRANRHWRECIRRFTGCILKVLVRHPVWNVTVLYACWWQKVTEATCTPAHILGRDRIKKERTIFWPYVD